MPAARSVLRRGASRQRPLARPLPENHRGMRSAWLRAAVLGANDGLVSTASLLVGVAAAGSTPSAIALTGVAALASGAMSMAAGEYVSVHTQADTESADRDREALELEANPAGELRELAATFIARGVDDKLATQVAQQLTAHDALGAHAREELGQALSTQARPLQAAAASAASFAVGAALPLAAALSASGSRLLATVVTTSLVGLVLLGILSAWAGGARVLPAAWRVLFWGALAMAVTSLVGTWFGAA